MTQEQRHWMPGKPDEEANKVFDTRISIQTVQELCNDLDADLICTRAFRDVFQMDLPDENEELKARILVQIQTALKGSLQSMPDITHVTTKLSTNDMDVINGLLMPKKYTDEEEKAFNAAWKTKTREMLGIEEDVFNSTEEVDEEVEVWFTELTYQSRKSALAAFVDLNLGFIEAGGTPREIFSNFYEGPLPK